MKVRKFGLAGLPDLTQSFAHSHALPLGDLNRAKFHVAVLALPASAVIQYQAITAFASANLGQGRAIGHPVSRALNHPISRRPHCDASPHRGCAQ